MSTRIRSRATSPAARRATATDRPIDGLIHDWLVVGAGRIIDASAELTELDARIGDGDHGINLARGFAGVRDRIRAEDEAQSALAAGDLLRLAGRLLVSSVGGAAGPLYGTFLMDAGSAFTVSGAADPDRRLAAALASGVAGVGRRGRSTVGQKTMLDTLVPASAALTEAVRRGNSLAAATAVAAGAATAGCESTRDMVAQRGRASYLGTRAMGHLDPGAVSSRLLIEALAAVAQPADSTPTGASR